ncbi:MAG: antibiotic biosynthesis monooxygenase [Chloroflexi bacterium RBG_19FT_COMBO_49_13]|nr:MAG: antibiotic biosynthesis monooxygenase [Chloroflexi bacterium RBG_19FT_COMBO_49_13]
MIVIHVYIIVKPECLEKFIKASVENASHSIQEPGIARFDFIQQADNPTKFLLVEVYRTADARAKHKETAHYAKWRDTVTDMMAEPRYAIEYTNLFPDENGW